MNRISDCICYGRQSEAISNFIYFSPLLKKIHCFFIFVLL